MWGRHILIGASCFTYICCGLYTVVSDGVCSSTGDSLTDRIHAIYVVSNYMCVDRYTCMRMRMIQITLFRASHGVVVRVS